MTGVTGRTDPVEVPTHILHGLPCWLGLGCSLNGESLLLPRLPHLLTPLALCFPGERAEFSTASTGQGVVASPLSLVPKFSLNRFTEALAHIKHHPTAPGIWLCQRQCRWAKWHKPEVQGVNTLRDKLSPKFVFPTSQKSLLCSLLVKNLQMVIAILTSIATLINFTCLCTLYKQKYKYALLCLATFT